MSWFSDLAGRAESLLNNIDEQTGAVLRNSKHDSQNKPWSQSRRSPTYNQKKNSAKVETKPIVAQTSTNKGLLQESHQSRAQSFETQTNSPSSRKSSPVRTSHNNVIKISRPYMDNIKTNGIADKFGLRKRRNSLPTDSEIVRKQEIVYNMQNLEVENEMLKNEINVMNREVSDLLDRLQKTEDELYTAKSKLNNSDKLNNLIKTTKDSLEHQLDELKTQLSQKSIANIERHKERCQELESTVNLLNDKNKHLEERLKLLDEEVNTKETMINKFEKELKLSQVKTTELQVTIDKSNNERQQLENDFDAYKLRVKNMLFAKDKEIKSLQDGTNVVEDIKVLVHNVESLKSEKEELLESLARVEEEYKNAQIHISQLEEMHGATERLVNALKEALKEEHGARSNAEAQNVALTKELQCLELQSKQAVADLRLALSTKEDEVNRLREVSSTVASADPSALNVADYEASQNNDKIQCLTQTLIQKQGKIDMLLADNNILRIQLGKLECKYKADVVSSRAKPNVIQFADGDARTRARLTASPLAALSVKIGVIIKRFPIFRTFIIVYMVGLHLWVLTVLLASTPENVPKPTKI